MHGGFNHRFGLYDGVMIKDNHIAFAGSITKAVTSVKEKLGHMVKVEVETENEEQVREAVAAGADIIMFDNRTPMKSGSFQNCTKCYRYRSFRASQLKIYRNTEKQE